jgi:hypothetical protein
MLEVSWIVTCHIRPGTVAVLGKANICPDTCCLVIQTSRICFDTPPKGWISLYILRRYVWTERRRFKGAGMRRKAPTFGASTQAVRLWRAGKLLRWAKLCWFVLLSPRIVIVVANEVAGFVRYGNANHSGLACLISNGGRSRKRMFIGRQHTNTQWIDILGYHDKRVVIDKRGYGNFPINASCVGVWVEATAVRRDHLEKNLYARW